MFGTFGLPVDFYGRGLLLTSPSRPPSPLMEREEQEARRIGRSLSQFDDDAGSLRRFRVCLAPLAFRLSFTCGFCCC